MDGRDSEITKGDHWSSELVLERRATFQWDLPAAVKAKQDKKSEDDQTKEMFRTGLVIRSLALTDASLFRCRVDYKEAQTRNLLVNLSIIGK